MYWVKIEITVCSDMHDENFLDEGRIWSALEQADRPDPARIDDILLKAAEGKGLEIAEAAALLGSMPEDRLDALFNTALKVKEAVYGKRMVLFAPLYVSNLCANRCAYCAFSADNKDLQRRSLNPEELAQEVRRLQAMGHKRIMAVYGEHSSWTPKAIAGSVAAVYELKTPPKGEIRRVNVNCAPLDVDGFAELKQAGIGTYQCFQETYHRKTYARVHLGGRKKDYAWRLLAMHRAQQAGLNDLGLGVLFGLFDYRFELLALLCHARELEQRFGAGPHTISFPRIEPAQNSELSQNPPYAVSDDRFKRIIAVMRLALPYTGMIITTRENAALKRALLRLGISQLSAASRTSPGGYAEGQANKFAAQQFRVGDERSLAQVIRDLQQDDYLPSFCTSCYRKGRTGEHFMDLAKGAFIHSFCQPNALFTFYEYLLDYAEPALQREGSAVIDRAVDKLSDLADRRDMRRQLERIRNGERDICV